MEIKTWKEAKKLIKKWLNDNGHAIKEVKDANTTFNLKIDYPLNTPSNQQISQPKNVSDCIIIYHGVAISKQHLDGLRKMKPKTRDELIESLHRELLFKENQHKFEFESDGILNRVLFAYPLYFDGLSKTNLYKALDINYKTFLYISMELTRRLGGPTPPSDPSHMYG